MRSPLTTEPPIVRRTCSAPDARSSGGVNASGSSDPTTSSLDQPKTRSEAGFQRTTRPSVSNAWVGTGEARTIAISRPDVRSSSASACRRESSSASAASDAWTRSSVRTARWRMTKPANTALPRIAMSALPMPGGRAAGPTVTATAMAVTLAAHATMNANRWARARRKLTIRTSPANGRITAKARPMVVLAAARLASMSRSAAATKAHAGSIRRAAVIAATTAIGIST